MDISNPENAIGVELKMLDLDHMDPGQLVEVVTDKGTFWITPVQATGFQTEHFVGPIAIWGTDFTAGSPLNLKCTRYLKTGSVLEIFRDSKSSETLGAFGDEDRTAVTIQHILLPMVAQPN